MGKITSEDLFIAIGGTDEKYLKEALSAELSNKKKYSIKSRNMKVIYRAAACLLILLVATVALSRQKITNDSKDKCGAEVYAGDIFENYYIYTVMEDGLYVYNINNDECIRISDLSPYAADENNVYYVKDKTVFRYDVQKDNSYELNKISNECYEMKLIDDKLLLYTYRYNGVKNKVIVINTKTGEDITDSNNDLIMENLEYDETQHIDADKSYKLGNREFALEYRYHFDDDEIWRGSSVLYEIKGSDRECLCEKNDNDEYWFANVTHICDEYMIVDYRDPSGSRKQIMYFPDGSRQVIPYISVLYEIESVYGDNIILYTHHYDDKGAMYYKPMTYNYKTGHINELYVYEDDDLSKECYDKYKQYFFGGFRCNGKVAFSCSGDGIIKWKVNSDEDGNPVSVSMEKYRTFG